MTLSPQAAPSRRSTLAALAAALIAVGVYAGTLGHGFVFDDGPEVVDNGYIRSLGDAPRVFASASWAAAGGGEVPMYRPLTTFSYALNYSVSGFSPFGFHLVNVLLHALVTVLVLVLGLRIGLPLTGAFAGALLFAVMPVHVEAVANVAGRKELLVAAFSIGAMLAHVAAVRQGGVWLLVAPLLVTAALFSKESGLSAIGLIAAYDLVLGRGDWKANRRRAIGLYAAYAAASTGFVAARHAVLGTLVFPRVAFDENPIASAPLASRLLTAVAVLGRGLWLLVLPFRLSADYSFAAIPPVTSALDPSFFLSALSWLIICGAAIAWRRRFPVGLFAFLWYAVSILPASNLIVPIGTIFGERLLYVPSVAVAVVAGAGLAHALERRSRRVVAVAAVVALCLYAARTFQYASVWSDDLSLFASAAGAQPRSAKAQRMLGGALVEAGRSADAQLAFERSIDILIHANTPPGRLSQPFVELAVALERLGRPVEAEGILLRTLEADPAYPDALWRLGVLRWQQGRRAEAVDLWRRALASAPTHARAMNDLGIAAMSSGDLRGAEELWRGAAASDPTIASPLYRLGNLYEREGRLPEARWAWTEFLARAHGTYPEWRAEVAGKLGTSPVQR
jgi:protein O-mannosyl-transferase